MELASRDPYGTYISGKICAPPFIMVIKMEIPTKPKHLKSSQPNNEKTNL
jgi:hypothetical protein